MKIGILTHYYGSLNYGGMLQAYALSTYLRKQGHDAEQISFQYSSSPFLPPAPVVPPVRREEAFPLRFLKRCYRSARYRMVDRPRERYYANYKSETLKSRAASFVRFQEKTPHSASVYSPDSIAAGAAEYDVLITGSDQVWNFEWFNPAFFLDIPQFDGKKIAYAASAGKKTFSREEEDYLRKTLRDFHAISVREEDLASVLNKLMGWDKAVQTVDPTLLLSTEDWKAVSAPRLVKEPYVFCYYLHNDPSLSRVAKRLARKKHCRIVTIPFPAIEYNVEDISFGDVRIDGAGPEEFLSLIEHAEYVLTDSFHATVFSLLFGKEFCAFPRGDALSMGSRLSTLTELFGCPERFCRAEAEKRFDYLCALPPISPTGREKLEKCKNQSEEFLRQTILKD